MSNEVKIIKAETQGGDLYITGESFNRELLTNSIRNKAKEYVDDHKNGLTAWGGAGIEKYAAPEAFDPTNPTADPIALTKSAKEPIKWCYRQTVRLTRML